MIVSAYQAIAMQMVLRKPNISLKKITDCLPFPFQIKYLSPYQEVEPGTC